jgi:amidohydrolase
LDIKTRIKVLSKKYTKEIISLRRKIHQNPELSYREFETSQLIFNKLRKLGLDSVKKIASTGAVGLLSGKASGNRTCVGLRADIDALPVYEDTDLTYHSKKQGVMHACGHDAHIAMVYGAALILKDLNSELNGRVKFIFQPAEEKNPGGASAMIKAGVLENPRVNAIFGQHVIPDKPAGSFGFYSGVMMASQDEIYITITGKAGHGAKPHTAIDPIVTASQVILALQTIVSRSTDPNEPVVLTIGKIEGGTTTNIIPQEVKLSGTVRTLNSIVRKRVMKLIDNILKGITSSAGARYIFEVSPGYPELNNDRIITQFAREKAKEYAGTRNVYDAEKMMAAEDFSYYLKKIPGTFYFIGTGNTSELHTPTFKIDESALPVGAGLMAYLAFKYLELH